MVVNYAVILFGDAFGPGSFTSTPHSAPLIEAALHSEVSVSIPIAVISLRLVGNR
jgi:hypothetical protein